MTARLNLKILLIAFIIVLVMSIPIYAPVYGQEATPAVPPTAAAEAALPESSPVAGVAEESAGQANGVTTLVLLIGLGAIALVGAGMFLRQNYRPPQG
jgi:hypothetical protein